MVAIFLHPLLRSNIGQINCWFPISSGIAGTQRKGQNVWIKNTIPFLSPILFVLFFIWVFFFFFAFCICSGFYFISTGISSAEYNNLTGLEWREKENGKRMKEQLKNDLKKKENEINLKRRKKQNMQRKWKSRIAKDSRSIERERVWEGFLS